MTKMNMEENNVETPATEENAGAEGTESTTEGNANPATENNNEENNEENNEAAAA